MNISFYFWYGSMNYFSNLLIKYYRLVSSPVVIEYLRSGSDSVQINLTANNFALMECLVPNSKPTNMTPATNQASGKAPNYKTKFELYKVTSGILGKNDIIRIFWNLLRFWPSIKSTIELRKNRISGCNVLPRISRFIILPD